MAASKHSAPLIVRVTQQIEGARALDPAVRALSPAAGRLIGTEGRRKALQGDWLGHAIHPLLTDLPLGFWTSASVLDLVGGDEARPAARRLIGLGVLSALPTAVTGWAEWGGMSRPSERRVGVVHAVANVAAVVAYTASWRARRRGRHVTGRNLALAGAGIAAAGGYLGAHLNEVREVATRHPAFE